MIKRLYVDNYKCLVNFTYKPGQLQLLIGENGTGKTTAMEVLLKLRDFVGLGHTTAYMWPSTSLTAWQSRPEQTFELEIDGNNGRYAYRLVIEHNREEDKSRIKEESLRFDKSPLYNFDGQDAHLFRDDGTAGPGFPFDWSRSAISTIPERRDNQKLTWFRQQLGHVFYFAINPWKMATQSDKEQAEPCHDLANFASWYRHLTQDSPEQMGPLFDSLREVIDGFSSLKLVQAGATTRLLFVQFNQDVDRQSDASPYLLPFDTLSEGQRCLIALFTILHFAVHPDATICIDEPDNFIALRELQPWLLEFCDRVRDKSAQSLLISHHPELIDQMAVNHGVRFYRDKLGPTRAKPFEWSKDDGISPSEIIASGWGEE